MPSSSAIPIDINKEYTPSQLFLLLFLQYTEEKEGGKVVKERLNNARKRERRVDKKNCESVKHKSKREKGQEYYGLKKNAKGYWVIDQKRESRKLNPFCNCKQSV